MARVHLFEFEDQPWFPNVLRESMIDMLSFLGESTRTPYRDFANRLHKAMTACKADRIVELCAGGGGPSWMIAQLLQEAGGRPVPVLLTDLYPNLKRFERQRAVSGGVIDFLPEPVDATRVPDSLSGFRLICNAFHHLPPELARQVLQDATARRQGIAIFEGIERSLTGFIQLFMSLGVMFVTSPFVKPFRLSRMLFTYVVPAVPFFTLWDGAVSCLRIYSPAELRELVDSLPPCDYVWDIGQSRVPGTPARITYLIGHPREV